MLLSACGMCRNGANASRNVPAIRKMRILSRCGRPISTTGPDHVQEVEELLQDDRRWTCEELNEKLDISAASNVFRILTQDLGMRKVAVRWVLHAPTNDGTEKMGSHLQTGSAPIEQRLDFLRGYIVAIDET